MIALWIASLTAVSTILLNILKTQQSILAVSLTIAILALGNTNGRIPLDFEKARGESGYESPGYDGGKAKDRKAYPGALAKIAVEAGEAVKPRDNMIWRLANLCEIHPRMLDRLVKTARIVGVSGKYGNASREPEERSRTLSSLV